MEDMKFQGILSLELSKVSKLEEFAKDLSKSISEKPITAGLDNELREDYIEHVIAHKPYKETRAQFKDWSSDALKKKIERITKMLNDTSVKPNPPNWKKGKQVNPDKALKLKRMRAELVAASYGTARSISRWSEDKIVETYKRLEQLRAKDPTVPQNPAYPPTATIPQQTKTSNKQPSASALSIAALKQVKRQK
ncbi:hypothetical protein Hanom_Chr05g00447991 [Helianthus anomalus]